MFKSIRSKDSQFPQLPKCFEIDFEPQKVDSLRLYVLFLTYFYFTQICEPLVTFCFSFLF